VRPRLRTSSSRCVGRTTSGSRSRVGTGEVTVADGPFAAGRRARSLGRTGRFRRGRAGRDLLPARASQACRQDDRSAETDPRRHDQTFDQVHQSDAEGVPARRGEAQGDLHGLRATRTRCSSSTAGAVCSRTPHGCAGSYSGGGKVRGHPIRPGRHKLKLVAEDLAGNRSAPTPWVVVRVRRP